MQLGDRSLTICIQDYSKFHIKNHQKVNQSSINMPKNLFNQVNINVNSEFFQLETITGSKLIELIVPISDQKASLTLTISGNCTVHCIA
jgi:hypothetical protein